VLGTRIVISPLVSQPRQILPQVTYLITRRTILRHMLLRPDHRMTQILLYLLAVLVRHHGMQLHAVCAMSTHIHLVVTDVDAKLPAFLQSFHRTVALCTKVLRRWTDVVWDKTPTSVVRLETPTAVIEKIAYVLANPVAAHLVRCAHQWPGAKVLAAEIGTGVLRAGRPTVYLDPRNPQWPEHATLPISLPPGVTPDEAPAFRRQVAAEIARIERHAEAEMHRQRKSFPNARDLRTISPQQRATSTEPRFDRNPTFAPGRGRAEAGRAAASALQTFRALYREALRRWQSLDRDVVFPAGTWWMHVFHRAVVGAVAAAVP